MSQQYHLEEKVFIARVQDWIERVERQHHVQWTPFLTPREVHIVQQLVENVEEIQCAAFGGFALSERQRMCVAHDYVELSEEILPLTLLNVSFAVKFNELKHSQILGSLLATGIERNRIGDIVTDGVHWQVCVASEVAQFLIQEVTTIGRSPVKLKEIPISQAIVRVAEGVTKEVVITSMRLDTLIAKVFNLSRQNSKNLIDSGKVWCNYVECLHSDKMLVCNDQVSVRHYGKFWIESLEGTTKKGNKLLKIRAIYK